MLGDKKAASGNGMVLGVGSRVRGVSQVFKKNQKLIGGPHTSSGML